jgi:hypothetical protein
MVLFFTGCPGSFGPTLDIEFQKLNREPGEPIVIRAVPDGFTPTGSEDYIWSVTYKKSDDIGYTDLNVYQPFEDDQALIYIPLDVEVIKVEVETDINREGKTKQVSDREFLYPENKKNILVEVFDPQGTFSEPDVWFKTAEIKSDRTPAYFRYIENYSPLRVDPVLEDPYSYRIYNISLSPNSTTGINPGGAVYANAFRKFLKSDFSDDDDYFNHYFNGDTTPGKNITISSTGTLEDWRAKEWHVEIEGYPTQNTNDLFLFRAKMGNSTNFVVTDIVDISKKLPNPSEPFEPTVVSYFEFEVSEAELTDLNGKKLWGENSYFGIILTEGSTLKGVEMVFSPDIEY